MAEYAKLPAGVNIDVKPFTAHVDVEKLQHFRKLLELSPIGPPVFENSNTGRRYGMEREWLQNAKSVWLNEFDWRRHEDRINSFPNFKAAVMDSDGNTVDIHFLALFSEKPHAIPIAFFHGWPGSICEFLDLLSLLKKRYPSPTDLPYHVIVPSLPGYAYSSGPPIGKDYGVDIAASALNNLMVGLGFGSGYLAQGGDLGSFISRFLAMSYDSCKGMHVNQMTLPADFSAEAPMNDEEREVWEKILEVTDTGFASVLMHGTRAATIGLALSASPLALLSWIGEKLLAWSDEDPPLEKILEDVTLYWMTDTLPRCIYHNRGMGDPNEKPKIARASMIANGGPLRLPYVEKPTGYSLFPREIVPIPKTWASRSCNLVSFSQHDRGGHFAAMERPEELLNDVEDFVRKVWAR